MKDYFKLSKLASLILCIIPITSWVLGVVTRFKEGKIVAALIRLFLGCTLIWVLDIIWMITRHEIIRVVNI